METASNTDPGGKLARLHGDFQQQMMDEDLKDAVSPLSALSLVVRKLGTSVAQTLVEGGFRARRAATHITLTDVPRLDSFSCLLWMLSIPSHIFDSGSESSITTRFSFNHS